MKHLTKISTSSNKDDYNTPSNVLEFVHQMDRIGLDPCSNSSSIVGAQQSFVLPVDGLEQSWTNQGLVFVNPPYGRELPPWMRKCAAEAANGAEIIALVPSRTGTKWSQEIVYPSAQAACFWKGRIKFLGAKDPAPFESALFYWGPRVQRFEQIFSAAGKTFVLQ